MSSEPHVGLPTADGREPVITLQGLGKCYQIYERPQDRLKQMLWRGRRRFFKEFWALRDVSVSVQPGETVGVIGANGAGKSTLLKILAGLLEPTTGSVQTRGRVVALLELGTGFNPQFTGRQNLYLNAAILGLTQDEIDRRFPAIAAFAEIGEFMDQPVRTYSSGMAVRLAFAVMAHMDAEVLIVDEALAVGDAYFVQRCMRFLRAFKERGTLFFVSHSTGAVVNLCHTALYLEHGRLIAQGNAKEVCEQYLADQHKRSSGDGPRAAWTPPPPLDIQALGRDPRQDLLAASNLRNDLQVFPFAPDQVSFGSASSAIFDAHLLNAQGEPVRWVIGGERVTLVVRAWARKEFINPVLGFFLKDALGQRLFGDNTYFTYMDLTRVVEPEELLTARFTFRMPILRQGDYSIDVAVGEGTQETHVIHEWKYDALLLRSHASSLHTGLVGIPMGAIELDIQRREDRPAGHPEETVPDHDR